LCGVGLAQQGLGEGGDRVFRENGPEPLGDVKTGHKWRPTPPNQVRKKKTDLRITVRWKGVKRRGTLSRVQWREESVFRNQKKDLNHKKLVPGEGGPTNKRLAAYEAFV